MTETGNLDLRGLALEGFLERDFHVVAQVGAALAAAAAPRWPAMPNRSSKMSEKDEAKPAPKPGPPPPMPCSNAAWPKRS